MKEMEESYQIQIEKWGVKEEQSWPSKKNLKIGKGNSDVDDYRKSIKKYVNGSKWVFPKKPVHFISDIHADADALLKSLVGAGMIKKKGPSDVDIEVLAPAKNDLIIIGGDCFDKGPSNLRVLDVIKVLIDKGANIEILAGNHDVRTYAGLAVNEDRRVVAEHMFIRMGKKTIPLFKEIYKKYIKGQFDESKLVSEEQARKLLLPSKKWYDTYEFQMEGIIPPQKIAKEVDRIQEKVEEVEKYLQRIGFTMPQLHATVQKAKELFVHEGGEYAWFFQKMKVAHQEGSFLFVHAGMDDFSTDWIALEGVEGLNRRFDILMRNDPFELYHGHIGNIFRTKYRSADFPFTPQSAKKLRRMKIQAIVHGHRNTTRGHRVTIKRNMLNFECDTTLDRKTRLKEDLSGVGAAWFTVYPNGKVVGKSTDFPATKVFEVKKLGGKIIKKLPKPIGFDEMPRIKVKKELSINTQVNDYRNGLQHVLRNLADDLADGKIQVESDDQSFTAELPSKLELHIEGKSDPQEGELMLKVRWNKEGS